MTSIKVTLLAVAIALLSLGLASTLTVLFIFCDGVISGEDTMLFENGCEGSSAGSVTGQDVPRVDVPYFFLPYGSEAGDTIVNGSQSQWMSSEGDYLITDQSTRGRVLVQLGTLTATLTLRMINIMSLGDTGAMQIFVNSGSSSFDIQDFGQLEQVWVRTVTEQNDTHRLNCMAGYEFDADWAFVVTWVRFEGSTFQVVVAFQHSAASLVFFHYATLNTTQASNKFATVDFGEVSATHSAVEPPPDNQQFIIDFSFGEIVQREPCRC